MQQHEHEDAGPHAQAIAELRVELLEAAREKLHAEAHRDGRERPIVHDLDNSIRLTRDLSHAQIAAIFKRIKTFISYDSRTLFSELAVLCGCESVVIPEEGVSEEEWRPVVASRSGVAYGFEKLPQARATAHLLLDYMLEKQDRARLAVEEMLRETDAFFPDQTA